MEKACQWEEEARQARDQVMDDEDEEAVYSRH